MPMPLGVRQLQAAPCTASTPDRPGTSSHTTDRVGNAAWSRDAQVSRNVPSVSPAACQPANPHFSRGGEMIAQRFGFTGNFLRERNTDRIPDRRKFNDWLERDRALSSMSLPGYFHAIRRQGFCSRTPSGLNRPCIPWHRSAYYRQQGQHKPAGIHGYRSADGVLCKPLGYRSQRRHLLLHGLMHSQP